MREMVEDAESTEITLGTGKLLGLFLGLVVICAIFFSLGYAMGKNSGAVQPQMTEAPATLPYGATPGPKPTAGTANDSAPVATTLNAQQATNDPQPSGATRDTTEPDATAPRQGNPKLQPASVAVPDSSEVTTGAFYVQVAAISKHDDAEMLVSALKKKSYPALISKSTDNLFHVQVGPFTDGAVARAAKDKLSGDGYQPILKRQ